MAGAGELADPVDAVVVVGREHKAGSSAERVGFPDESGGGRSIGGEDDSVLGRVGIEMLKNALPCLVNGNGGGLAGGIDRVGVAEHGVLHARFMCPELGLGRKSRTGVVKVDMVLGIEVRVFSGAEMVQRIRGCVFRM